MTQLQMEQTAREQYILDGQLARAAEQFYR
jgi:hypothetical protein